MSTVATSTPEHDAAVTRARLPRTLMGGTRAMRAAGEQYLPREAAETTAAYKNRLSRATLFNAFKKTVADMTGRVFSKPVVLESDMPAELVAMAENIDLAGRHLNVFARDAFYDALQPGIGYIYVDMPPPVKRKDGLPATLQDEQALRPYLTYIPETRLIGWKSAQIDGVETLTQIRIKECVSEPDGEYAEKEVEQIRVVTMGADGITWQTFRRSTDKKDEWIEHESGTIVGPKSIPLAPIYINRTGFMRGAPPLEDLADLNVAHWQSQSDQRNILHVARVPILFGTGIAQEDVLEIGPSSMIRNSNPAATLQFVEHTGAAIGAGDRDLKNLEFQMTAFGLQLIADNPGQTATGEIRDDVKENSTLASMAAGLQDALEQAFGYMAEFKGLAAVKGGSVNVNKADFGINGGIAEIQYLTQAVIADKIDDATYIDELKRRGVLADSVNPEVVLSRIAEAPPAFGRGSMDLQN